MSTGPYGFVTEGEVLLAKAVLVDDEHEDVIYDLISTTQPERYTKSPKESAFAIPFGYIAGVEEIANE